ncbi:GDSL esterase/lipase 6 [Selaginella moellendorffii]|uniref:GDSL esterase/lipase 6 n=1 Tax=Selaginella moellendorffii TaxID=88036 RepID=UPI000D1CCDC2|nr:GDSL esterase/lipase 6 [Selaginella moellendorffii]|eukprot:XP_002965201.2 GDSL esterase/lipase 6 [Selaginella moellendorffii]
MNFFGELYFLLAVVYFLPALCLATPLVPALFIFGDSLVDVGTNYFVPNSTLIADIPPFGETHFHHPNGRYSNGLIPSDFLAWFLNLPLVPPYLDGNASHAFGANFASSGAGLLDITNEDRNIISYTQQINQFYSLVSKWKAGQPAAAVNEKIAKSIIHINIGSNDIITTYFSDSKFQQVPPEYYVNFLILLYNRSFKALYDAGARKFAISELGPLGCTPLSRHYVSSELKKQGCYLPLNSMAKSFNFKLNEMLAQLRAELPDAKIITVKSYEIYMDMIRNASKYGFIETRQNCCGAGEFHAEVACGMPVPPDKPFKQFLCQDPSKYLFWDLHPTEQGYRFFSNYLWRGGSGAVAPFNLQTLVTL